MVELDCYVTQKEWQNSGTATDALPLPLTDGVLDAVGGHEVYNFLDGFSGYIHIRQFIAGKKNM